MSMDFVLFCWRKISLGLSFILMWNKTNYKTKFLVPSQPQQNFQLANVFLALPISKDSSVPRTAISVPLCTRPCKRLPWQRLCLRVWLGLSSISSGGAFLFFAGIWCVKGLWKTGDKR